MIEKVQVTLWDLFVYVLSGALAALIVCAHLVATNYLTLGAISIVLGCSPSALILEAAIILPLFGLIVEPLANYVDYRGRFVIRWALHRWSSELPGEREAEAIERPMSELIRTSYMSPELAQVVQPYDWCKDVLLQRGVPTPYMAFLAKFGFYRNIAFLSYANALILLVLYPISGFTLTVALVSFVLGAAFSCRSHRFYHHLTRAV